MESFGRGLKKMLESLALERAYREVKGREPIIDAFFSIPLETTQDFDTNAGVQQLLNRLSGLSTAQREAELGGLDIETEAYLRYRLLGEEKKK